MDYRQALAWLYATQTFGIKLGLENMRRLVEALGVRTLGGAKVVHIAGTNGKGSVAAMIDSICRADGLRSGLFTSPHLVTFRERIRVNGEMIGEKDVAAGLSRIRTIVESWSPHPTFFEITTALALRFFQEKEVEIAVLETGLGGRLDATNVVTPHVSVLTSIGLDHQAWLGSTLEQIAAEKAGIIKRGVPVVSAPQEPGAADVLREAASRNGAPIRFVDAAFSDFPEIGLRGSHQRWNAALSVEALKAGGILITENSIENGLRDVTWPGRFQIVASEHGNQAVLDGAHNAPAAMQLVRTWREVIGNAQADVVLGILDDKDATGICNALVRIAASFTLCPVKSPRSADVEAIAAIIRRIAPNVPCAEAPGLSEALSELPHSSRVLVTGSLFLIGEALVLLGQRPCSDESSAQ